MAWIRLTAAISTGLLLAAGGVPAASAQTPQDTVVRSAGGQGEPPVTVRLATGDRVTVTPGADGRRAASVEPGPGREGIVFRTYQEDGGDLTVLPSDAADLVSAGTLDRRLFDVSTLIAQGYDEAGTSVLPLIVSASPRGGVARTTAKSEKAAAAVADRVAAFNDASAPARTLASIGARSLSVADDDLGAFWKALNPGDAEGAARAAATPRVWLDGRVAPVLDRSTAQINAPAAWKAGYEGQGVKVAVLDTGVDAAHPDLAGRIAEAKDFSGSGNTVDHFGHGTHVASIVGGTGAASSGSRKGVAPKAELLIGKVLGDDGYGSESQVIDGMEWAAGEHAKVVNMSLGSDEPTDGTDPMSQALNTLSASGDTLFVVAAGNAGQSGDSTIGSPGAADAALTVGAVDRGDSLASFSSRGPRLGDKAVKPDVTAPGVGIVAARASGTTMGDPVDANYTAASGTSMATPHVAGAVALIAQQHPGWTGQQLKDALISTAHTMPGTKATEQGGGRIDVAAAMGAVTATGSVLLPAVQVGGDKQQSATLHYTNTGAKAVDLKLSVALADSDGEALTAGVVAPGTSTVHLAPGASADVPLSTDPKDAKRGAYYGYATATGADGTVLAHTTLSLVVHAPQHRLTVIARDRAGKVLPGWLPTIWGQDGFVSYTSADPAIAVVEEGTYQVDFSTLDNASDGQELVEVINPQVKVAKDTTVTLDASKVTQVQIRTPQPAEQRGILSYQTYRRIEGHGLIQGVMFFDIAKRIYVSPTAQVTDGTFEFASRWQMTAPQLRAKVSGTSAPFVPYYLPASPVFDDKGVRLTAVDAGAGTPSDLKAAHVRGKLAVVRYDFGDDTELAKNAADAGAKALMLVMPGGFFPWTRWQPEGDRLALPIMRAGATEGTDLLERAGKRTTTVDFSGTVKSPYLYDVMQVSQQRVPEKLVYTVSERNSAVVKASYTRTGAPAWASEQRFGWRPYQEFAWNQYTRDVPVGQQRTEYVTAGDTVWSHTVHHDTVMDRDLALGVGMRDAARTYRPGQHAAEKWFAGPVRPSIPHGVTGWPGSVRNGDTLSLHIPEFTDSQSGHWSFAEASSLGGGVGTGAAVSAVGDPSDVANAEVYRNGRLVAQSDTGAWGGFEVPAGKAGYRLDLTTARTSADWRFGTGTRTSWTFTSDTAATATLLPLLQVDYSAPVDLRNAVGPRRSHTLGLNVRMPDGLTVPRGVTLKVEASYDDGRTWHTAHTARTARHGGTRFTAAVERPSGVRGDAYVSLRVTAVDGAGNSVRQTVDRAYLHRGPSSGR
ncbi:S8 family serine peptidase [Streptomyces griseorubiginosus]|uniref:S8 family serine peptidase n=1 Tax=Streptomyces griseorubiginosus TaxID=67304 RepID=UPI001AD66B18|nr:S8 family serine peptidase [Streptomyces griseorubiginosus]MBO4256653.1 S8 family serine peptidase [Streptomyces griseorubiginosus]